MFETLAVLPCVSAVPFPDSEAAIHSHILSPSGTFLDANDGLLSEQKLFFPLLSIRRANIFKNSATKHHIRLLQQHSGILPTSSRTSTPASSKNASSRTTLADRHYKRAFLCRTLGKALRKHDYRYGSEIPLCRTHSHYCSHSSLFFSPSDTFGLSFRSSPSTYTSRNLYTTNRATPAEM